MITMKKKILSLFLAVVMLSLALVGCGSFDYAEDSTQHATFKADDYLAALLAGTIEIDDGTFTADPETREQKVLDSIYNKIDRPLCFLDVSSSAYVRNPCFFQKVCCIKKRLFSIIKHMIIGQGYNIRSHLLQ